MPFAPEPEHRHGRPAQTGVLLLNLGTPDAPTAPALRRYLAEFLSDRRVVEIPRFLWWPILHGIVLRTRPAKSAKKYAGVWTPEGSPLQAWTEKQRIITNALDEFAASLTSTEKDNINTDEAQSANYTRTAGRLGG